MHDTYGITVDASAFDSFNSIQVADLNCNWAWDNTITPGIGDKLVASQGYTAEVVAWDDNYRRDYDESGADDGEWVNLGNGFYTRYLPPAIKTKCDEQGKRYKLKYR